MPFVKGQSGNRKGRPKGIPDKVSQEVRQLARSLFSPAYWARIKTQLANGELPPQIHTKMLAYAYGEPAEHASRSAGITVNIGFIQQPGRSRMAISEVVASPARVLPPVEADE